jgi:hypothetical protein
VCSTALCSPLSHAVSSYLRIKQSSLHVRYLGSIRHAQQRRAACYMSTHSVGSLLLRIALQVSTSCSVVKAGRTLLLWTVHTSCVQRYLLQLLLSLLYELISSLCSLSDSSLSYKIILIDALHCYCCYTLLHIYTTGPFTKGAVS